MDIKILYEDKDIIVAVKPPKVSSQPDKTGDEDMVSYLTKHLKNGYVGLVHRLDKPVGGVMVFAKNEKANADLSKQIQQGSFSKQYLAVVCGKPVKEKEKLVDLLWKNERLNMSKVVCKGTNNAKEAILEYELLKSIEVDNEILSLVRVYLYTGRHHQIRVQMSNAGFPLWGDTKYNPKFGRGSGARNVQVALWAETLSFKHPCSGKEMIFSEKTEEYPFSLFED